jgi:hypothetical protein
LNPIILYDNRFLDVPVIQATDTDTIGEFDVRHIRDLRPYTFHKFSGPGTKYYTVNSGVAGEADCLAVYTHNLGSASAQVSVESSNDNFGVNVTQRLAPFVPSTDLAVLKPFTLANEASWRVKIVSAALAAQNAVVLVGKKLTFPGIPMGPFAPYRESVMADAPQAELGSQLESNVKFHPIKIDAKFQYLDRSWLENTFLPFWDTHMKKEKWFFFAWNLDDFPRHVFFVKRAKNYDLQMPLSKGYKIREFTISLEGISEF